MTARAIIAEDEPLARRTLREFLGEVDWVSVVGEAEDGRVAVRLINKLEPDLLFLDVQMPEMTGIEVLQRISHRPAVVFTTAFDRYAVTAFELEAIDYLVKPFGRKRFHATIERVRQRLKTGGTEPETGERLREALSAGPLRRLFARKGDKFVPLDVDNIVRAEAGESYVTAHANGQRYLLNLTLNDLWERLDAARFRRVHRSHIVNLDHVAAMAAYDDRRLVLTMSDGSSVVASRAGSQDLRGMVT